MKELGYVYHKWEDSEDASLSFWFLNEGERVLAPDVDFREISDEEDIACWKESYGLTDSELEFFDKLFQDEVFNEAFGPLAENEYEIVGDASRILKALEDKGVKRLCPHG